MKGRIRRVKSSDPLSWFYELKTSAKVLSTEWVDSHS